jgi:hypothetical protein
MQESNGKEDDTKRNEKSSKLALEFQPEPINNCDTTILSAGIISCLEAIFATNSGAYSTTSTKLRKPLMIFSPGHLN